MRNVVVVCLDTVRKDFFDDFAPQIQRLADVSFSQCRSASSWTVPSHASMFTGALPFEHGVHTGNLDFSQLAGQGTVMGDLTEHTSYCVSANPFLSAQFGANELFDELSPLYPGMAFPDGINIRQEFESDATGLSKLRDFVGQSLAHDYPLRSLANGVGAKLDQVLKNTPLPNVLDRGGQAVSRETIRVAKDSEEPFFLFANFMDAHGGLWPHLRLDSEHHDVPNSWSADCLDIWAVNTADDHSPYQEDLDNYRALYGAAVAYLDDVVAEMIQTLRAVTDRETAVVVTADHGENLGFEADNYLFEHKASLTEGVLHVPLCIVGSGVDDPGRYVSQTSLRSLIVDLATADTDGTYARDRIAAELIGLGQSSPDVANEAYWHRMLRCAYCGDQKIVWDSLGGIESYALSSDTASAQTSDGKPAVVPDWATTLFSEDIVSYDESVAKKQQSELDGSTLDQLDELGYL